MALRFFVPIMKEEDLVHHDTYSAELMLKENEDDDSHDFQMLVKFHIMGFSAKELADEYKINIGNCKKRLQKAREYYRKRFDDLYK